MATRVRCIESGCGWFLDARGRGLDAARLAAADHVVVHSVGEGDAPDAQSPLIVENARYGWVIPLTVLNLAALLVAVVVSTQGMSSALIFFFPQVGLWSVPIGAAIGACCVIVVAVTAGSMAVRGSGARDMLYRAWAGATAAGLGVFIACAGATSALFAMVSAAFR